VAAQLNSQQQSTVSMMDDSMMTPYGPPSPYAYIIPVPNDCVGLVIGKGGETIRLLQQESGAKIQVAKKEIPNSNLRNVFVEGTPEKYQKAKDLIEEIIRDHRRSSDQIIHVGDSNPFYGNKEYVPIPDKYVGLVIGKSSENLKGIAQRSNTKIFVP
jgi:far upstream element-binding protein